MAPPPDLNNASPSLHPENAARHPSSSQPSPNHSRRASAVMGPPPLPQTNSIPSSPRPPPLSAHESPALGGTTGPIRHPRPLTAAELHLELEKEQESIVNRLTRELSALRAQTASVASTASSTSDLFTSNPPESHYYQTGIIPTSARRHRSSSNLSSRSARSARDALTSAATATSVSGVAAPRDRDPSLSHQTSGRPSVDGSRPDISRQNSMSGLAMHRSHSNAAYPSSSSPHWTVTTHGQSAPSGQSGHLPLQSQSSRHSVSSSYSAHGTEHGRSPSTNAAVAAARYEEAALHRAELEVVKKENEVLKQRIRDLEKSLSARAENNLQDNAAGPSTNTSPGTNGR